MSESPEKIMLDVNKVSQELRIRPEVYVKIVTSFSQTLMEKVQLLEDGLAKRDWDALRRILHEIKGTASNLRLKEVTAAEEVMHAEVKGAADPEKLRLGLVSLKTEAERLRAVVANLSKG